MRKIQLFALAACACLFSMNTANAQAFEEGKSFISLGYGYSIFNASTLFGAYETEESFSVGGVGPVNFQYEYAVGPKFGIGVDFGYSGSKVTWTDSYDTWNSEAGEYQTETFNYEYSKTKITANLRGNAHFGDHDVIDPYLGFGLGFKSTNWKLDTNDDDFGGVTFSNLIPVSMLLRFGARFVFTENIGAFIEGGAGHGVFQGGLTVKL